MTLFFALSVIVGFCILAWLIFCALIAWNGLALYGFEEITRDLPSTPVHTKPRLSVIIPACNEAETLEDALQSLRQTDYPNIEIILINDRSTDKTPEILNRLGSEDPRIYPLHITFLPGGWLGKVNALRVGTKVATGDFLLFTDADVHFNPDTLSRAISYMEAKHLDHLSLLPEIRPATNSPSFSQELVSLVVTGFAALFLYGLRLRNVRSADSRAFAGVGAFNMVRRSTFAKTKGWEWLKMEVIDDVGLGKMMKEAGGKCDILNGVGAIHLEWYPDFMAIVRGFEKNLFAGIGQFNWFLLLWRIGQLSAVVFLPYIAAILAFQLNNSALLLGIVFAAHCLLPVIFALPFGKKMPVKPYLLGFLPLSFLMLILIMLRSAWVVTRKGGISWRDTFYPLKFLRHEQRVKI